VVGYSIDWDPKDSTSLPKNGFYMWFTFKKKYPSKKTWKSFRNLVGTITEYGLVYGNKKAVFDIFDVVLNDFSEIMFFTHGHENPLTHSLGNLLDNNEIDPPTGSEPA
jgi:hypothetical protein